MSTPTPNNYDDPKVCKEQIGIAISSAGLGSDVPDLSTGEKRKLSEVLDASSLRLSKKKAQSGGPKDEIPPLCPTNPTATWASCLRWPKNRGTEVIMKAPVERKPNEMDPSTSESGIGESEFRVIDAYRQNLAQYGIHTSFMGFPPTMNKPDLELCHSYLEGDKKPRYYPSYPRKNFHDVFRRARCMGVARIARDITPNIVPSPEMLTMIGEIDFPYLAEWLDEQWTCTLMGGKIPRPDISIGFRLSAFTAEELDKLQNWTTPNKPSFFTRENTRYSEPLVYPFLTVETEGSFFDEAEVKNLHNGAIMVRSIIELFVAAYGENDSRVIDLHGRALAFSVSHGPNHIALFAHFAAKIDGQRHYATEYIHFIPIRVEDEAWYYKAYNFARNLYHRFAPDHLRRIKDAIASLPHLAFFRHSRAFLDEECSEWSQPDSPDETSRNDGGISAGEVPANENPEACASVKGEASIGKGPKALTGDNCEASADKECKALPIEQEACVTQKHETPASEREHIFADTGTHTSPKVLQQEEKFAKLANIFSKQEEKIDRILEELEQQRQHHKEIMEQQKQAAEESRFYFQHIAGEVFEVGNICIEAMEDIDGSIQGSEESEMS